MYSEPSLTRTRICPLANLIHLIGIFARFTRILVKTNSRTEFQHQYSVNMNKFVRDFIKRTLNSREGEKNSWYFWGKRYELFIRLTLEISETLITKWLATIETIKKIYSCKHIFNMDGTRILFPNKSLERRGKNVMKELEVGKLQWFYAVILTVQKTWGLGDWKISESTLFKEF